MKKILKALIYNKNEKNINQIYIYISMVEIFIFIGKDLKSIYLNNDINF